MSQLIGRHDHHGAALDPAALGEPIGAGMAWHIWIQLTSWMILMPAGALLGMRRSPWHVPCQVLAIGLTLSVGFPLGHHHGASTSIITRPDRAGGRAYLDSAHAHFAKPLFYGIIGMGLLGGFLKTHAFQQSAGRRWAVRVHGFVGKALPVAAWTQCVFGGLVRPREAYDADCAGLARTRLRRASRPGSRALHVRRGRDRRADFAQHGQARHSARTLV